MENNTTSESQQFLREILGKTRSKGLSLPEIIKCIVISIKVLISTCLKKSARTV